MLPCSQSGGCNLKNRSPCPCLATLLFALLLSACAATKVDQALPMPGQPGDLAPLQLEQTRLPAG